MDNQNNNNPESQENLIKKPCHHPYLETCKITGEKVCVSCGRTVYSGQTNNDFNTDIK